MNVAARGALFFVFIIGIVYGIEAPARNGLAAQTKLPAKGGSAAYFSVVSILNPPQNIQSYREADCRSFVWRESGVTVEKNGGRLPWLQGYLGNSNILRHPLIGAIHWQPFGIPHSRRKNADDTCACSPDIGDIELSMYKFTSLEHHIIGSEEALGSSNYDVSNSQFWSLVGNKFISCESDRLFCGVPEEDGRYRKHCREKADKKPLIMVHIRDRPGDRFDNPAGDWMIIFVLGIFCIPALGAAGVRLEIIAAVVSIAMAIYFAAMIHLI